MIRPIIAYGDPILKKKAAIININESNELTSLIDDMWETMYNAKGVGIAAPQIGVSKSIFVADFSFFEEEENFKSEELTNMQQVFINPEIISEAGEDFIYPEGCLSIPNISENVVRKRYKNAAVIKKVRGECSTFDAILVCLIISTSPVTEINDVSLSVICQTLPIPGKACRIICGPITLKKI